MHILCYINPAAGQDYPILAALNRFFQKHDDITWDLYVTNHGTCPKGPYDYIVAYGGDGTIIEAIETFEIPVLPLQGGTANVIAKDIGIPVDPEEALALLKTGTTTSYDAFKVNEKMCYCRVFTSSHAKELSLVQREDKDTKGLLAYVEAFVKGIQFAPTSYTCTIDGEQATIDAHLFLITNFAQLGMMGIRLDHRAEPADGMLDLIAVTSPVLPISNHRHFQELTMKSDTPMTWAIDDNFEELQEVHISVVPNFFTLLGPGK